MSSPLMQIFTRPIRALPWQNQCWDKSLAEGLLLKGEDWQYFPTMKFMQYCQRIEGAPSTVSPEDIALQSCVGNTRLVFENGRFSRPLSSLHEIPSKVVVLDLSEVASSSYAPLMEYRQKMLMQEEADVMALVNGACSEGGVFIYIPPGIDMQAPLEFAFIQTDPFAIHVAPRIHIIVGARSRLTALVSSEGGAICNGYLDIGLEEKAQVRYMSYSGKKVSPFSFFTLRASLKRESSLHADVCNYAELCRRENYKIALLEEGAQVEIRSLSVLAKSGQTHAKVRIEHKAPRCESQQMFKQVLSGHSRASFMGTIFVEKEAQKTEAYQLCRSLILSDAAQAYTKPNLEIFADDVKASHGATIAQIDEEQRQYMQSRGIPFSVATHLLTEGFCREMVDKISMDSVRVTCEEGYKECLLQES